MDTQETLDVSTAADGGNQATQDNNSAGPDLVIITGMSGAGRTEAMHTFEDIGYFCIDNLPPSLLSNLVSLAGLTSGSLRKLCIVCDLRAKEFFGELTGELLKLDDSGLSRALIFLDCSDDVLLSRFKATRRRHPLCDAGMTITTGIQRERKLLAEARRMADYVLDTSHVRPQEMRRRIHELFSEQSEREGMGVNVYSFGFKHGAPTDADIVMDVRFLPNPYYVDELRSKTGKDKEVRDYVMERDETRAFLDRWFALLDCVMPGYVNEGKQYLSVAIGCTGGQHRSVAIAEATGHYLSQSGYHVGVSHRDLPLAEGA